MCALCLDWEGMTLEISTSPYSRMRRALLAAAYVANRRNQLCDLGNWSERRTIPIGDVLTYFLERMLKL